MHFFDDDLRYTQGIKLYSAHFPRCERRRLSGPASLSHFLSALATVAVTAAEATAAATAPYWTSPPRRTAEVLFEDARTGEFVGWDAELNIPGDIARTMMLVPASEPDEELHWYWLVDSASSQLLYNREWVLRSAPFSEAQRLRPRRLALVPVVDSPIFSPAAVPNPTSAIASNSSSTTFTLPLPMPPPLPPPLFSPLPL